MTEDDLKWFVNRARCECGQEIWVSIRTMAQQMIDNQFITPFVGARCDEGVTGINQQARPCVQLAQLSPQQFASGGFETTFSPIWLSSGIAPGSPDEIENAQAFSSCEGGQGSNTGVWICAENGMASECQADEFIITGSTNINSSDEEQMGITYDFQGPNIAASPDSFRVEPGDGSLRISWSETNNTDIQGYRILCADAQGNPLPGKGRELRSVPSRSAALTERNQGQIYYTASNLCPEGPFTDVPEGDAEPTSPDPGGTGGTGATGDNGGSDTGGFTTGIEAEFAPGGFGAEPNIQRTEACCSENLGGGNCGQSRAPEDIACANLVRAAEDASGYDYSECAAQWTRQCADKANQLCISCGSAGPCCTANSTPGCFDANCMEDVCTGDSISCCEPGGQWTSSCAEQANSTCSVCMLDPSDTTGGGTTSGGMTTDGAVTSGSDTGGSDTAGTDTGGISSAIETLDWDYICSGHIAGAARSARIDGLDNETEYQVLVVAYDRQGNPTVASNILTGVPKETIDFWEQCEQQGGICGDGGFCSCSTERDDPAGPLLFTALLGGAGLARRRRRGTHR